MLQNKFIGETDTLGRVTAASIPERIAHYAIHTPDQLAIADQSKEISYGDLERESSQLAARLLDAGAGEDRCIGLYVERSVGFIVAALAVMKSGSAYLPLDQSTPPDRVGAILKDAGAIALITTSNHVSRMAAGPWRIIKLDVAEQTADCSPKREIDPDALAYVIYTSGSTGEPKGVEITHANLHNLIDWHQSAFGVSSADRAGHVANLGFDAAVWEIWPYLTAGASIDVADELTRRSAQALRDWIVARNITICFAPTVMAEQLLQTSWPRETALRVLLTGGDVLGRRPHSTLPFRVFNNYGPTECAVVATSGEVLPEDIAGGKISIGRPIANATAFILDDSLRPVQPSESGELCIGGASVGRGYRNQPQLTARQFVTYLSTSGDAERIYRTGDRVRLMENGEISFLGRLDDQIKIRGYRIEPGEIMAWLNRFSGIQASAIAVRDVGESGPSLVAYIVPTRDNITAGEVRDFLSTKLPDYMVPTLFVAIPRLPTLVNGKLDKTALPAPSAENVLTNDSTAGNSSELIDPVQHQITELVAAMLGQSTINPDDNFFMIGGHSMLGVQIVARIRDVYGVQLSLRQLFAAPTVAALSAMVTQLTNASV